MVYPSEQTSLSPGACAPDRPRILVIDDELGPRESLRFLLKSDYEVQVAETVARGLELLRGQRPDVIVMDIRMPGMNGIEGLREIRKLDQNVAIIMLTGFGALETAQEAIRHGANDYMKKPFDASEMREAIRRNLQRAETSRKRALAERDLAELNRRLSDELQRKERMASLGLASAELVHDLRNPLQIVMGYVQLLGDQLARQTPSEERLDYLDAIQKSVSRCKDLVESWLSISRHEHQAFTDISLGDIAANATAEMLPLATARKAQIVLNIDQPPGPISGNARQLARVAQNLIANAIDALPAREGCVEVIALGRENRAVLEVRDNGCGMTAELLEKIFEPFSTTKREGRGTGLGLFISRRIIEDHGGSIVLVSQPGKGTTATVSFPFAAPPESPA